MMTLDGSTLDNKNLFKRICVICGSNTTYILKDGTEQWYNDNNKKICKKCYNKIIVNPKWHPITSPKRINFKGKVTQITINPRTGYCSRCSNNIFDRSCKRTHIHHIEYHDNDYLKDTIELCASCHMKETLNKKRM